MEKQEYIELEELINLLREKSISIGKGDPYNTLRYYTKIGWLPNMHRKKNKKGEVTGHYASDVIEKIKLINHYKEQGLTNELISQKLDTSYKWKSLQNILKSKELQDKIFKVGVVSSLVILIVLQTALVQQPATPGIDNNIQQNLVIIESGTFFIPKNRSEIYIKTNNANVNNKIYLSFKNNYAPATRYWYELAQTSEGFIVKLDSPVIVDTYFDWWVTE